MPSQCTVLLFTVYQATSIGGDGVAYLVSGGSPSGNLSYICPQTLAKVIFLLTYLPLFSFPTSLSAWLSEGTLLGAWSRSAAGLIPSSAQIQSMLNTMTMQYSSPGKILVLQVCKVLYYLHQVCVVCWAWGKASNWKGFSTDTVFVSVTLGNCPIGLWKKVI